MKAIWVKAFADAATDAASERLGATLPVGEELSGEQSAAATGIAALVGLTGALRGRLLLELDAAAAGALFVAARDRPRALADFAEEVTGRAIASLRGRGVRVEATPPMVFAGKNLDVTTPRMETVSVRIGVPDGVLLLSIAARDDLTSASPPG